MTQNTQDQRLATADETTPQDSAAMSPASAGSAPKVVVLPKPPMNPAMMRADFASGWFFHSAQAKIAMDRAGVRWTVEE